MTAEPGTRDGVADEPHVDLSRGVRPATAPRGRARAADGRYAARTGHRLASLAGLAALALTAPATTAHATTGPLHQAGALLDGLVRTLTPPRPQAAPPAPAPPPAAAPASLPQAEEPGPSAPAPPAPPRTEPTQEVNAPAHALDDSADVPPARARPEPARPGAGVADGGGAAGSAQSATPQPAIHPVPARVATTPRAAVAPRAAARDSASAVLTIVPASSSLGPRPTGSMTLSIDGRPVATLSLATGRLPGSSIVPAAPFVSAALEAAGHALTLTYSGDATYEPSRALVVGVTVEGLLELIPALPDLPEAPDLPRIPPLPRVPALPKLPGLPSLPGIPRLPKLPGLPSLPDIPRLPGLPAIPRTPALPRVPAIGQLSGAPVLPAVARAPSRRAPAPAGAAPRVPAAVAVPSAPRERAPAPGPPPPAAQPGPDAPAARPVAAAATPASPVAAADTPAATPAPRASELIPDAVDPPREPVQRAGGLLPYDLREHPERVAALLAATFTLLHLLGSGARFAGTARGGASPGAARGGGGDGSTWEGTDYEMLAGSAALVERGDRSRTWMWPGTRAIDHVSSALPAPLARRSPLAARVIEDATYLRAMLGSASLTTLLAGGALGLVALVNTGGEALPPIAALTIAIAVLGVLDAAAGMLAVTIFVGGVLAHGGVDSYEDVRMLIALGAVWFVVPIVAGAARPLRREPVRGLDGTWDRAADFLIASLVGAWAVQQLILALPGLAGSQLPIAAHADAAAIAVLIALICRIAAETVTAHLYPRRLATAEPDGALAPGSVQRLLACLLRAGLFVFFALTILEPGWQLWACTAMFVVPQVLALFEERLPNSPRLFRALPHGLLELVVVLFVVTAIGALLLHYIGDSEDFVATSFVVLAIPGFVLSIAGLVGRDGDERELTWRHRVGGVALLGLGVPLALGMAL